MLELNALSLLQAATAIARAHQILSGIPAAFSETAAPQTVALILPSVTFFRDQAFTLGASYAVKAADRLIVELQQQPCAITVGQITTKLNEIESRFADFVSDITMFVMNEQESIYMRSADDLVGIEGFSEKHPMTSHEVEEAAKCLVLGRTTASVFHSMRMLEIGIRAFGKLLGIPDPVNTNQKNWGQMLKAVRAKIDDNWPPNQRFVGSDGATFENLYASLDAVRNPWRNTTMHVEKRYTVDEAIHILRCSAYFIKSLFEVCDEDGNRIDLTPP